MPIPALYAAPLTILFIVLSFRVIFVRRSHQVSMGDAGDKELSKRIRVHANFAEYAPLALILLGVAELSKSSIYVLHAMGVLLLIGRAFHAYGMSQTPQIMALRASGMVITFTSLAIGAVACLVVGVRL